MSGNAPASWDDSKPRGAGLHRAIVYFLMTGVSVNALMTPWVMQQRQLRQREMQAAIDMRARR